MGITKKVQFTPNILSQQLYNEPDQKLQEALRLVRNIVVSPLGTDTAKAKQVRAAWRSGDKGFNK